MEEPNRMPTRRSLELFDIESSDTHDNLELFIVEGESASLAADSVRDRSFQAILPMQGKPLNAFKAKASTVDAYPLFVQLQRALGLSFSIDFNVQRCRFRRILLLFDSDADGIHCSALMLIYFLQRLPSLLDSGMIHVVRAPVAKFEWQKQGATDGWATEFCVDPSTLAARHSELKRQSLVGLRKSHYRGLASLEASALKRECIAPETRNSQPLGRIDAQAALQAFGGSRTTEYFET